MSEVRSGLLELLKGASVARKVLEAPKVDLGIADVEPYPFLAIVGQAEMKLALVLAVINPLIGGVLLVGSRGTAKKRSAQNAPRESAMANLSLRRIESGSSTCL